MDFKGQFTRAPSPKSQHGGKVRTCGLQGTNQNLVDYHKSWILITIYEKMFVELGLRVVSSFLLDPTCNTSPKPHLQKELSCRHPCHSWDLGLETLCEVVSLNAPQHWRLHG